MLHIPNPRLTVFGLSLSAAVASAAYGVPYRAGELQAKDTIKYGAFEARIRAAEGNGILTAFFMLKDGLFFDANKEWEELDFEIFGKDGAHTLQSQVITPGDPRTQHMANKDMGTNLSQAYHTYRIEWTPERLSFLVDGQVLREERDYGIYGKLLDPNRAEPMRPRISIWGQDSNWSGRFDASKVPAHAFVSYIKEESYAPKSGPNGSDFKTVWQEDFKTFEQGRWSLPASFFEPPPDPPVSDAVAANTQVRDGYLILSLTKPGELGYKGSIPQDPYKPK